MGRNGLICWPPVHQHPLVSPPHTHTVSHPDQLPLTAFSPAALALRKWGSHCCGCAGGVTPQQRVCVCCVDPGKLAASQAPQDRLLDLHTQSRTPDRSLIPALRARLQGAHTAGLPSVGPWGLLASERMGVGLCPKTGQWRWTPKQLPPPAHTPLHSQTSVPAKEDCERVD